MFTEFDTYKDKLDEAQKTDIDEKKLSITKNWEDLRKFLEARMPIIEDYVAFHGEADNLQNLFKNLENTLMGTVKSSDFPYIDELWNKIQNQFTFLKAIAKKIHDDISKVSFFYL